ncbi:MAG: alpha/beta fold hydrolase [Gemmatimonadaceae bacterium]
MLAKARIVLVHGALGSAAQMEPISRALEQLGVVDNVQLLGHGTSSGRKEDFSMPAFVQQLHDHVQRARQSGWVAPLAFGYSMGGYAALALEVQHPGIFSGIVTLGTKFAWTPALASRESSRLNAKIIAEKIPKFAKILAERHAGAGGWETVLERTAALLVQLGDAPLLTRELLGRVQAAVCIAVGEKDDSVSGDEAREYASFVPGARTVVLPDVPHPIERVPIDTIVELVRSALLAART